MTRPNLRIEVRVIPGSEQRYETAGDYYEDADGVWQFRISRMGNRLYEMLILIHELTEWAMCEAVGIKEQDITDFDVQFEKDRAEGKHSPTEEPGDSPLAPYTHQHRCATKVERLACKFFGIRWDVYDRAVEKS